MYYIYTCFYIAENDTPDCITFEVIIDAMAKVVKPVLVIHGGAGVIPKNAITPELEAECRDSLKSVLLAGYKKLKETDSSMEAVVESVRLLEDSPCFNAGHGSVFTTDFTNELDAGIMDGTTGKAGGVSVVTNVKNPILLAKEVMDKTNHTVLCGVGAETFAKQCGLELVDQKYFYTARRHKQILEVTKDINAIVPRLDHDVDVKTNDADEKPNDTVGAVAIDSKGRLVAACSTGGLTGKMPGRLSDSSIPGAGFYADLDVAVAGTGNGDYFLRRSTCLQVAHLVKYEKLKLADACSKVVREKMPDCSAGVIAVDKDGNFTMAYNCEGMFRGFIAEDEEPQAFIWDY